MLTGWGLWLETCEILDVRIVSTSLFKNLQVEYREKQKQDAEKISGDTEQILKEEKLTRENDLQQANGATKTKQMSYYYD